MSKRLELKGIRFGRLLVLDFAYVKKQRTYWKCKCDCGVVKGIRGKDLVNGHSRSCGCSHSSVETKRKISKSHIGIIVWNKGMTAEIDNRILIGKDNPNYNPNLTDKDRQDRRLIPGIERWRCSVYERDNYTCQKCGNAKGGNLVAHHIESYNSNKELRTVLLNGVTLCKDCHKDFHHQYGCGDNTREQWEEFNENSA